MTRKPEQVIKIVVVVTVEAESDDDPAYRQPTPSMLADDVVELLEGMGNITDVRYKAQYGE